MMCFLKNWVTIRHHWQVYFWETIYKKDQRIVKHIGAKSFGIQFILKGIYIHNGKYYFHTELRNRTNVPFGIDLSISK